MAQQFKDVRRRFDLIDTGELAPINPNRGVVDPDRTRIDAAMAEALDGGPITAIGTSAIWNFTEAPKEDIRPVTTFDWHDSTCVGDTGFVTFDHDTNQWG